MFAVIALAAAPLFAAPPPVVNGSIESLASLRAAPANGWIGYSIVTREPLTISCCDSWNNGSHCDGCCRLDRDHGMNINRHDEGDIGPVGERTLLLFARLQDGAVDRVRVFSPGCSLDGAGQTIRWVEGVPESASVAFLRDAVVRGTKQARSNGLLALSLHANATDTLIDLARHHDDRELRGQALFWLSQQAGRKAADALKDAVNNDPEESVRAKAVFGISQLPNDESIPLLVDLMKHNKSREVRKKAAFWLGQKNDPRALAAIEEMLRN